VIDTLVFILGKVSIIIIEIFLYIVSFSFLYGYLKRRLFESLFYPAAVRSLFINRRVRAPNYCRGRKHRVLKIIPLTLCVLRLPPIPLYLKVLNNLVWS